jgi:hypothetical protein
LSSGRLGQDATGFFFSSDTNGKVVKFLTNNGTLNEWMRITSAGNVGIGTQVPGTRLQVAGGSVSTDTQFISTVATGTAPLSVASTTMVPNLNAAALGGLAPGAFAQLAAANTFTGNNAFSGFVSVVQGGGDAFHVSASAPGAIAVRGDSSNTNGSAILGSVSGINAVAVYGSTTAAATGSVGIFGIAQNATGIAGAFDNTSGGQILSGRVNGVEKFSVSGSGVISGNGSGLTNIGGHILTVLLGNSVAPSTTGYFNLITNYVPPVNARALTFMRCAVAGTAAGQDLSFRSAIRNPTGTGTVTVGNAFYLHPTTAGTETIFNENNDFFDLTAGQSYDFGINLFVTPPAGSGFCSGLVVVIQN